MKTSKQIYDEFWKDIIEKDGVIRMDELMDELADFYHVIENVTKVYCDITGGRISKPLTDPIHVIQANEDIIQDTIEDAIKEYQDIHSCSEHHAIEKDYKYGRV